MKRVSLGEIATVASGGTPDRRNAAFWGGNVPWVKTGEIQFNVIRDTEEKITEAAVAGSAAKVFQKGTLLMAMYGQGKTRGQVAILGIDAAINQACAAITLEDTEDVPYVFHYLAFHYRNIRNLSNSGSQENLNAEVVRSIPVQIPPKSERHKIADILTTWDEGLEKLDALIAAKDRRKKALMQQLLTGRKRVKGFDQSKGKTSSDRFGVYPADWKRVSIGKITKESSARHPGGDELPVFSSTKHRGLVLSEEYFGKRIYADDTSNYRLVKRGEFAYATNHIEEGSIGYQDQRDAGLVSPIYTVFRTTGEVDDGYLYRVLKSTLLIHFYRINTSSSVDRRGSLRYKEFARIHIWLPSKAEQRAIAAILDTCDEELRLLRAERTALDQQKRGLMQRLLTGKIRVRV